MEAAKIANEIIGVRTGAMFAIVRGIEVARVMIAADQIKRGSRACHTLWS
jgi:hypothetical protein